MKIDVFVQYLALVRKRHKTQDTAIVTMEGE